MGRGGRRPGSGRPARPVSEHLLHGSYRRDRHGAKPATVLTLPAPEPGWTPNEADRARLSPRAGLWLTRYWRSISPTPWTG